MTFPARSFWVTPPVQSPVTPTDEFQQAVGIRLSHNFAGNSVVDTEGGLVLAPVNAPTLDNPVTNTLDGSPLITDPPSLLWSHSYRFSLTSQRYETSGPTAIDFAEQSFLISATVRFGAQAAVAAILGNRDVGFDGFEMKFDQPSGKLQVTAKPVGGGTLTVEFDEALNNDVWHEVVMVVDRSANRLRLGTVTKEADGLLSSGSLTSPVAFSIGNRRLPSVIGDVMGVRLAFGPQVEGLSPKNIAKAIAPLIWWDAGYDRVVTPAK